MTTEVQGPSLPSSPPPLGRYAITSVDKPSVKAHEEAMPSTDSNPPDETAKAIGLILGATILFSFSDACAKLMLDDLSPVEVNWIRSVVTALVTLVFVLGRKGRQALITTHPWRQTGRGLAVVVSSITFLMGLSFLPLADNSAINYVWPIMVTVLSVVFLKEKIGIRRVLATLIGFCGMLIMIRPGTSAFQFAAIFPLIAALLWAIGSVMTRGMTADEAPETTMLWSAFVALIVSTMLVPFFWVTPSLKHIGLGLVIGLGSAMGHALVIFAFRSAAASTLAPYTYIQLIWAGIWGYLMFNTLPDRWIVLGGAIIAASGIYTAHREHVRRQEAIQTVQLESTKSTPPNTI